MIKWLLSFFHTPSVEEAEREGYNLVMREYRSGKYASLWADRAAELEAMASGGFNTKPHHRAFDRGAIRALAELEDVQHGSS